MVEMPFENEAGRALEIYGFHKSVNAGRAAVYPPPRARASNSDAWISARLGRPVKKTPSPSPTTVVAGDAVNTSPLARGSPAIVRDARWLFPGRKIRRSAVHPNLRSVGRRPSSFRRVPEKAAAIVVLPHLADGSVLAFIHPSPQAAA
jgi:hypothetical protein